jgi:hypothetical protein
MHRSDLSSGYSYLGIALGGFNRLPLSGSKGDQCKYGSQMQKQLPAMHEGMNVFHYDLFFN